MGFRYPNLITLNEVAITDESRTFTEEREERAVRVTLASGKNKKFVQCIAKSWTLAWENVSANSDETVDGFGGRDELHAIAQLDGFMTLTIDDGKNTSEEYTVEVDSYSEQILMRRGDAGFRYTINMTLKEQGG
jgi:hypothetical protein